MLRLEWSDVDLVRGFVTVAAHKSKTARRRLIPIAQNLAEWLRPCAQMSGPVYSTKTRNYHADIEALRSSIGLSTWPKIQLPQSAERSLLNGRNEINGGGPPSGGKDAVYVGFDLEQP